MRVNKKQKKTFFNSRKIRSRIIFASLILLVPVIQQIIFYIGVNFNSFLQAFQIYEYNPDGMGFIIKFAGIENFANAVKLIADRGYLLGNSFLMYIFSLIISLPLALIFSFYVYKKFPLSKVFRVILFMPQIVSMLVFSLLFKYLVTEVYMKITGETLGLLVNQSTRIPVLIFFNIWISFGVNTILYSGAMSGIDNSIVESAQLDGVNLMQEFIHITFPMIFSTFTSFIVIGIAGICTNQANLYNLFGEQAQEMATLGYYLFASAKHADYTANLSYATFGELSALGLILTAIVAPVTLGVKALLEKFGPSEN